MTGTSCTTTKLGLAIFFISFLILVPSLRANSHGEGEVDKVEEERRKQAKIAALENYDPNPLEVTDELNEKVYS